MWKKQTVPMTETHWGWVVTNTKKHPSCKDVTSKVSLAFRSIAKTLSANRVQFNSYSKHPLCVSGRQMKKKKEEKRGKEKKKRGEKKERLESTLGERPHFTSS